MSKLLLSGHGRLALQICAASALAALMSGCSADATRLGDPFQNPFSSASNDSNATARPRHVASNDVIPAGRTPPVRSHTLAPTAVASAPLYPSAPSKTAFREPVSRETTGSIETGSTRVASNSSFGGWTTSGGTPIQVAEGENANVLAQRYGVPLNALLQVNGLRSAAEVRPGAHLTVPVYSASAPATRTERVAEVARAEPAPRAAEPAPRTEPRRQPAPQQSAHVRPSSPRAHEVAEADSPSVRQPAQRSLAVQTSASTRVAHAEPVSHDAEATPNKAGRVLGSKPGFLKPPAQTAAARPLPTQKIASAPASAPASVVAPKPAPKAVETAPKAEPARVAAVETAPAPAAVAPAPAPQAVASADNSPEFRWPARGRIIQSFKGGSGGNDGINIAVPEGTSVRAAEGGVVAYAGSELKGYGNLVLIRHPNGFVTAYANNGSIDVKRGDTVKRGQEIAKSGQSGNVSSPQLHFELRKGATPVDPTQYLAGL